MVIVQGLSWLSSLLGHASYLVRFQRHLTRTPDLLVIGSIPTWPHSNAWGYYPSGGLGLILVIVIALVLLGRI